MSDLMSLLLCAAHAPIVGVTRKNSHILHAITLHEVAKLGHDWPKALRVTAACGTPVKIISPIDWWAPRIRGTKYERCPNCVEHHGTRTRRPPRWAVAS